MYVTSADIKRIICKDKMENVDSDRDEYVIIG